MIHESRFRISHNAYAIDLSTVTGTQIEYHGRITYSGHADAVWYRRKNGYTRACIGTVKLWSHNLKKPLNPSDPRSVLSADMDGRYGGDCQGRWDGEGYWGAEIPAVVTAHLSVLRPMLTDYPSIPDGYDGWWRFQ